MHVTATNAQHTEQQPETRDTVYERNVQTWAIACLLTVSGQDTDAYSLQTLGAVFWDAVNLVCFSIISDSNTMGIQKLSGHSIISSSHGIFLCYMLKHKKFSKSAIKFVQLWVFLYVALDLKSIIFHR